MRLLHAQIRVPTWFLLAVLVLGRGARPAQGFIDRHPPTLTQVCKDAKVIAVLKLEKIHAEKKAIVWRKVRDLKRPFPAPPREKEVTITHILRNPPQPEANQDQLNDAILALAAEGKTAVMFQLGTIASVCVGRLWYTLRGGSDVITSAGSDSRFARIYCGDLDALITAVTDILAGKEVTVPRLVGNKFQVNDHAAPLRRWRADRPHPQDPPTHLHPVWATDRDPDLWSGHRGNPQRTGTDGGPGPKGPKILWVHKADHQFIAPLVPGNKDLYASALGGFNTPVFQTFALDPTRDRQLRRTQGAPLLALPLAAAPALVRPRPDTELLIFGDGFHTDEGSSLRCVRGADGFPLWQFSVEGKLVHFEGTPTVADRKLYTGGGNAGVLCLDPNRVTLEGKEQDLASAQVGLERRWKELLSRYEIDRKKDPQFTLRPDESMLPRPTPRRIWQQGRDRWHVDAPVAVVEDRVLAASASLDEEKAGECALVCLKSSDGSVLWKTPLKYNPWAGPTVGPYVVVGCSSIRLDPKTISGARGEVVAADLDTGKIRWRKEVPGGVLSSVAVKAGLAIFTATDGKVRACDAFTGAEKWTYDARAPFFAGPAVTDTAVYVADLKGVVHALRLVDGRKDWTLDLAAEPATKVSALVYGSPVVRGGRLYLATCNLSERAARTQNVVVCIGDR
jgi:outer membrane protein assembly factor BamB